MMCDGQDMALFIFQEYWKRGYVVETVIVENKECRQEACRKETAR
jgi:hypothetical protein